MNMRESLVNKVLSQFNHSPEADYYLNHYHGKGSDQWVMIKVGGQVLRDQLSTFVEAIALLVELGLKPVILHGAGSQIDKAFDEKQLKTEKIEGLRVTDQQGIEVIGGCVKQVHDDLIQALIDVGVNTIGLFNNVFECVLLDKAQYGYVGTVSNINMLTIQQVIDAGQVPVLSCLGMTTDQQMVNINADAAIRSLVWQTHPVKVIFVTPTGGMLDDNHQLVSSVQLTTEYDQLMQQSWLHSGMKLKIQQIYQLLKPMPRKLSVSMTATQHIVQELFTHKGKGTFISMGEHVIHYNILGEATKLKLKTVLEMAFAKQLKPRFFEDIAFEYLLMAESGEAAALITSGIQGKPYLDKFAVTPLAQGQGLGKAMWQSLLNAYDQLYWRSRRNNPISQWYYQQADWCYKKGDWIYFSYGMSPQESLQCMEHASAYHSSWQEVHYEQYN